MSSVLSRRSATQISRLAPSFAPLRDTEDRLRLFQSKLWIATRLKASQKQMNLLFGFALHYLCSRHEKHKDRYENSENL